MAFPFRVFFTCFFLLVFDLTFLAHAAPRVLSWGGDSEGGSPFIFQDPKDPRQLSGFEHDIMNALADELGAKSRFVQNQWDGLIPGLKRGNYDVIANGLEITDDRRREISFSIPYYVTYEQISVLKDDYAIKTLDDLVGQRVGTLKSSLAERILLDHGGIEVVTYDDDTHPYSDLEVGRLRAVLMDYPIAKYRSAVFPGLKFAGQPVGQMFYGIGVRHEDTMLLADVNRALDNMIKNGKLREILASWGLWDDTMVKFTGDDTPVSSAPQAYIDFVNSLTQQGGKKNTLMRYLGFLPLLGKGALVTLQISILSMCLAVLLGLLISLVRLYAPPYLAFLATAYVELIRGTPLLIQLFIIFYGLPHLGIKLSPLVAAVLGLGCNYAAYEAENYRAGILSIAKSQMDAALALGMTRFQSLRHVILPQALRLVLPPVTNDFISLLKDSSLVSVITMVELTKVYGQLAAAYFDYLGIGLLAAAVYFLIGLPFVRLSRYMEKRMQNAVNP